MRRWCALVSVVLAVPALLTGVAGPAAAAGPAPLTSPFTCWFADEGAVFPVTGNWDGIGGDGPGIFDSASPWNEWKLRNNPSAGAADYAFTYSAPGDAPIVGNWDGIGGDGPGVIRDFPSGLQWHLRNSLSAGPADSLFLYGLTSTDCAVRGNWDGVGGDGIGIVRQVDGMLQWHVRNGASAGPADAIFTFGEV